jgi:hypothetical protein
VRLGMNRASLAYMAVCTIFALGIWAILEAGTAYLTAPRDLQGRWILEDAGAQQGDEFSISQSGEFVRFSLENGTEHFDAVFTQSSHPAQGTGDQLLKFDGDGWHVEGVGSPASDTVKFIFQGPDGIHRPRSGTYRLQHMNPSIPLPTASEKQTSH